ncbi:MAG TPA: hypothetical protein VNN22_15080 [Verrucomicrobiae bacterium]|nr:hypothetical protein [Verrucomicrobiae bacterium]
MKEAKAFAILLLFSSILLLIGCSSVDVSKNSGFSSYVGRDLPLQSAAALKKNNSDLDVYYDGIHSKFILMNDETPELGFVDKAIVQLPTNHIIVLDKARVEFRGDLERIVAYGHTTLPNSTNQINFAYLWGTDFQIQRAPW